MELLSTIAEYFGMTIDELLGMKNIRETVDADKILEIVRKNYPERLCLRREKLPFFIT